MSQNRRLVKLLYILYNICIAFNWIALNQVFQDLKQVGCVCKSKQTASVISVHHTFNHHFMFYATHVVFCSATQNCSFSNTIFELFKLETKHFPSIKRIHTFHVDSDSVKRLQIHPSPLSRLTLYEKVFYGWRGHFPSSLWHTDCSNNQCV